MIEKIALSESGNVMNCQEIRSHKFNLRIMGEPFSSIIFYEEKMRERGKVFGFSFNIVKDNRVIMFSPERKLELCGDMADKIAFFLVLKKKARGELDCSECKFNCMLEKSLKKYMQKIQDIK